MKLKYPPKQSEEYDRRNTLHCAAVGAESGAKVTLARLGAMRRPPFWLVQSLKDIHERASRVAKEMAAHRDEAWTSED